MQAGYDARHKLFVNNDTGTVNDTHALSPMAFGHQGTIGRGEHGYPDRQGVHHGKAFGHMYQKRDNALLLAKGTLLTAQRTLPYDRLCIRRGKGHLHLPGGQDPGYQWPVYNKAGHKVKNYKNRLACKACGLRDLCKKKQKRTIYRAVHLSRGPGGRSKKSGKNPEYHRLRQQITEHQFGTLKRQWGFTYTLIKGKENVLSEVNLIMICYNLKRIMSILGPKELKNRLKGLGLLLLVIYHPIKGYLSLLVNIPNLQVPNLWYDKTSRNPLKLT